MFRNKVVLKNLNKEELNQKSVYFEFEDAVISKYLHIDIGTLYVESYEDGLYSVDLSVKVISPDGFKIYSLNQQHVDQITKNKEPKTDFILRAVGLPHFLIM